MKESRFCIDCRWSGHGAVCGAVYRAIINGIPAPEPERMCMHPSNIGVNPVDGSKSPIDSCEEERRGPRLVAFLFGQCGPDGRHWESKEDVS